MACGCTSACGCDVVGDGSTAAVVRQGDKFIVSSIRPIEGVDFTDCIALEIDDEKILTASPILSSDPSSVELECTENGLAAHVVVDPASTAIVSEGPDGLRVDVPAPAEGSIGPQPGDLIFFEGIGTRAGAIDADGSEVDRDDYAALHDALSLKATTANRVSGDDVITGIPSTRFMAPGMPLEATGFPFGMTVAAVLGSTSIQASAPADTSGGDTEVRVYPHGNGDGISTFNTPNASRRYPLGYDYAVGDLVLGDLDGGTATLAPGNLPLHDHPATATVNDSGHDHGATGSDAGHDHGALTGNAGSHAHEAGADGNSDFVTIEEPVDAGDFISVLTASGVSWAPGGSGATLSFTDYVSIPTHPDTVPADGIAYNQGNRDVTSTVAAHQHSIPTGFAAISVDVVPNTTGITVDVDVQDAGSATPTPVDVDPAHIVGRWMVVV